MKKNKVANPLNKRVFRELIGEWHKYLVIALFLIFMISFISAAYVANNSMITSLHENNVTKNLEDGAFEVNKVLDEKYIEALEKGEKADIKTYYMDKAKEEADKEVETAVNEAIPDEIDKAVREAIEDNLRATVTESVDAEIAYSGVSLSDEEREAKIQSEVDKNLDTAIGMFYDESYGEAYDEFMNGDGYQEALDEAREEAYEEVEKTVNEEYEKAADKYDLENPDYEPVSIQVYENFYKDSTEDRDGDGEKEGNIRLYRDRDDVDMYSILEGTMPQNENEIAIDRMHADNVKLKVGDTISVGGNDYKITALIALVNYSTLYEKSTDSMFDAIYFDVAIVTDSGFDRVRSSIHYNYAWTYDEKPEDVVEEKEMSENVMASLISQAVIADAEINEFLPNYANNAIHFAEDDLGSDMAMSGILLDIMIVVLAFIFAITISSTINKEASVIGTLRASGYTKAELVAHYMAMPVLVTLIAAIIGNILGYTYMKDVVVGMYYNSYSLPTYKTLFTYDALVQTTIIPVIIMFIVNLIVIIKQLGYTPLQFLRHDLKKNKNKKAMRIPRWSFFNRFRTRIMLQNLPNYLVLILGVSFVMMMLSMAIGFPDSLKAYQAHVDEMMFADYQTILKTNVDDDDDTIETSCKSAERFSIESVNYNTEEYSETISVYGIQDDSKYVEIPNDLGNGEAYISSTFSDKYGYDVGDTITLSAKYDNDTYTIKVAGIYDYMGSLSVYMSTEGFNELFDKDDDYFSGFLSNEEIEDIDSKYIATTITIDDITKISRQLDHSMGAYMTYFQYLCIILSAVLIYLLAKVIIEKNENAISMVKILGYENREISSLYMTSTTIVVIIACLIGEVVGVFVMNLAFKWYLMSMEGWFDFVILPLGYVKMFLFGFLSYVIVMFIDYNRIKKIPMDEALKNVE